jgi:hypothetical protein
MCDSTTEVGLFDHLNDDEFDLPAAVEPAADGQITSAADAKRFISAGKAVVTLKSKKTGNRFTYRVSASEDKQALFVGLLTGPSNDADYKYIGRIARDIFWVGRKVPRPGDVSRDAPSVRAFEWTWKQLVRGQLPDQLEVWHEGRCGRCARRLTVPESIRSGFGPECAGKLGYE